MFVSGNLAAITEEVTLDVSTMDAVVKGGIFMQKRVANQASSSTRRLQTSCAERERRR